MKGVARVMAALAILNLTQVEAGWFGEEPIRKRFQRDRNQNQEGPQQPDSYEDVVEPTAEEPSRDNRAQSRREKLDKMRKGRAKDMQDMVSEQHTREVLEDKDIADTFTPDSDDYLTDDQINKIWAEHMHDFVPEDMLNAVVEHQTTEALFHTINHKEPTTIKGAYYVLGGNREKTVSCIVYDPNREIVYKRTKSAQGIIIFDTTVPGEYAIIFNNQVAQEDLTVTLAMHTYEDQEEQVKFDINDAGIRVQVSGGSDKADETKKSDADQQARAEAVGGEENLAATQDEVGRVRHMLREIQTSVKQIQSEAKLSMLRQDGHNEDLLRNQDWNFYFMLIEALCFFLIVAFQTNHIQTILDNKLII